MITQIDPHNSVVFNASGAGQVAIGPPAQTNWRLNLVNCSDTGVTNAPTCTIYRGSPSGPLQQVDILQQAHSGSSGLVAATPFYAGQVLWAVWSGGDAGATGTVQAYGQQRTHSDPPFDLAPAGNGFPTIPPSLLVGGAPAGPGVYIGNNLPLIVRNFYIAQYGVTQITQFSILMYVDATHYAYMIVGTGTNAGVSQIFGLGWVEGAAIQEHLHLETFGDGTVAQYFGVNGSQGSLTTGSSYIFGSGNGTGTPGGFLVQHANMQFGASTSDIGTLLINYAMAVQRAVTMASTVVVNGGFFTQGLAQLLASASVTGDLLLNGISLGRGVLDATNVVTVGAITGPASAETDIPNVALSGTLTLGRAYVIYVQVLLAVTVATDIFDLRVRLTTAVTGTQIADMVYPAGTGGPLFAIPIPASLSGAQSFKISFARRSGTGTATAQGAPVAGQSRTWSMLADVSSQSQWRST